ncbi:MAG: TrmH family RNA methyltransferase [Spirochaetaceae bacterium]
MITVRKLKSLPPATRIRKTLRLIEGFEQRLRGGEQVDTTYLLGLLESLRQDLRSGEAVRVAAGGERGNRRGRRKSEEALREEAARLSGEVGVLQGLLRESGEGGDLLRSINAVRHSLRSLLAMEPGEWDLLEPEAAPSGERRPWRLFEIALYLEEIRSPFNLGSIARSAEAFGAAGLILSPGVPSLEHPRAARAAMGAFERLPLLRCGGLSVPEGCQPPGARTPRLVEPPPVFALEFGGTPIGEFEFPDRGVCLLGSEELGLSPAALTLADGSAGRCTIPLFGGKGSLNVAVAAGILLSHWTRAILERERAGAMDPPGEQRKGPADNRQGLFERLADSFRHGFR